MGRLSESSVPNIKNKSFAVTAEVVVPDTGAEGVILSQGGRFGGWSLYTKEGKLKFCYNFVALEQYSSTGSSRCLPASIRCAPN